MEFNINKKLPISIKDQLKGQILGMINDRQLLPGTSLPSCSDMAAILSINRNTVAKVYSDLVAEGVLMSNRGAGTSVSTTISPETHDLLHTIMESAFCQALESGFTNEEITQQFFNCLAIHAVAPAKTVLMVWCNHKTSQEVGETLTSKLGVQVKSILVNEIIADPSLAQEALRGVDLVITSLNYIEVILPHAQKKNVEVAGIFLTPVSRVLNDIVKMEPGTRVGFVCVNNLAAESACKSIQLSGMVTLETIWAGADNLEEVKKMISNCNVIFATHHVYDQVLQLVSGKQKVFHIDASISDSNIAMIRERLADQK